MAKRKAQSSSEEDEALLSDSSEPKAKRQTQSKKKKAKSAPDSGAHSPSTSAAKVTTKEKEVIRTNNEGAQFIDLGKKKRATVRSFKDIPLLDIREFYGEDEKPGKKGISLTLDQWQVLKAHSDDIDRLFAEMKSKK